MYTMYMYIYIYVYIYIYIHISISLSLSLYIYIYIYICREGTRSSRECLGHRRKGTPGTGNAD